MSNYVQLLPKSLIRPSDLFSQLYTNPLYACSTSTILIASVQRP